MLVCFFYVRYLPHLSFLAISPRESELEPINTIPSRFSLNVAISRGKRPKGVVGVEFCSKKTYPLVVSEFLFLFIGYGVFVGFLGAIFGRRSPFSGAYSHEEVYSETVIFWVVGISAGLAIVTMFFT